MELDYCLSKIYQGICTGKEDSELLQSYTQLMAADQNSLAVIGFIEELKNEISNKYSNKQFSQLSSRIPLFKNPIANSITPVSKETSTAIDTMATFKTKRKYTQFKCQICGESFPSPYGVRIHRMKAHRRGKKAALGGKTQHLRPTRSCFTQNPMSSVVKPSKSTSGSVQLVSNDKVGTGLDTESQPYIRKYEMDQITGKYKCPEPTCLVQLPTFQGMHYHCHTEHPQIQKFKCDTCDRRFSYSQNYKKHKEICGEKSNSVVEIHDSDSSSDCMYEIIPTNPQKKNTQYTNNLLKQLKKPRFVKNKTTGKIACPWQSCRREFHTSYFAKQHYNLQHNDTRNETSQPLTLERWKSNGKTEKYPFDSKTGKFKCRVPTCPKIFPDRKGAYEHYRYIHGGSSLESGVQRGKRRKANCLKNYEMDFTTGKYKCQHPTCSNQFTSRQWAHTHFQSVHLNIRWKCDFCPHESLDPQSAKRHRKVCAQNIAQNTAASTKSIQKARRTRKIKTEKSKVITQSGSTLFNIKCPEPTCPNLFSTKQNAEVHHQAIHLNVRYQCDWCGKEFSYSANLSTHKKTCTEKYLTKQSFDTEEVQNVVQNEDGDNNEMEYVMGAAFPADEIKLSPEVNPIEMVETKFLDELKPSTSSSIIYQL